MVEEQDPPESQTPPEDEQGREESGAHYPDFMHTAEEDELGRRQVKFSELVFRVGFLALTWAFVVRYVPRVLVVTWLSIWAYRFGRDLLVGVTRKSSCLSLMVAGIGWIIWGTMFLLWLD